MFLYRKKYPDKSWDFIFTYLYIYKIEGHYYQLLDDFQYVYPVNSVLMQIFNIQKSP